MFMFLKSALLTYFQLKFFISRLTPNVYKNAPSAGTGKKLKFFDRAKNRITLISIRN